MTHCLLFFDGKSVKDISNDVKLTVKGVRKILNSYFKTYSISAKLPPGKDHSVITDNVLERIEWNANTKFLCVGNKRSSN